MKDQRKCMVHFEDKGMFPKVHWRILDDSARFLGRIPRGLGFRMEDHCHCKTAMTWVPEGRRKVGRPKTTWRCTAEKERNELGWKSWNEAKPVASNRARWRECTAALWATWPEEDR